jgi:hypothetical protein
MHWSFDVVGNWCVFCVRLIYYLYIFCKQSLVAMGRVHLDRGSTPQEMLLVVNLTLHDL